MRERGCLCPSNAMLLPGPAGNPVCTCCLDAAEKVRDYTIDVFRLRPEFASLDFDALAEVVKEFVSRRIMAEIIAPKGEEK